ncbi:hypothetical protein FOZ61_001811 [Perkinsus olseni]|uniref:Uncharacterized protein n=1 Tax=Perkinsus olseni TaxID=32597 RepID=A0A7J6MN36_PEROL|nr:hypothetical protein FOZ61_001811 [Perkinsus olseni]KAF4672924.1 hypothetical protein FOL46_008168 [Perkinsus olseni]
MATTGGILEEVKGKLVIGLHYLLRFLHACAKILRLAVVVSTPVLRRLLFLSLKMFSSIISKLKNVVSSKDQGEAAEGERIRDTPGTPAEASGAPAVHVEAPVESGETEEGKTTVETPAKEISDKKGKRHSTTPLTAPKGDREPPRTPKKDEPAPGEGAGQARPMSKSDVTGGGGEGAGEGRPGMKSDDVEAGEKKGKKRGGKKKKAADATGETAEKAVAAAPKTKAVPKKKAGKGEDKTDAGLERENANLAKEVEEATRKYRAQQEEISKARREKKEVISVAAQLYQIAMGIEPMPRQARTDSFALPKPPSMGEQTRRGAETARTTGSAPRYPREGSQQQRAQASFFMNSSGGQVPTRRSSNVTRPSGADKEADLNNLIKEAKAHQALLRAKSQTKLEGENGGKPSPEEVRGRLRTGNTKQDLEEAIKEAKELDMSYEAGLAEKKLKGLKE